MVLGSVPAPGSGPRGASDLQRQPRWLLGSDPSAGPSPDPCGSCWSPTPWNFSKRTASLYYRETNVCSSLYLWKIRAAAREEIAHPSPPATASAGGPGRSVPLAVPSAHFYTRLSSCCMCSLISCFSNDGLFGLHN